MADLPSLRVFLKADTKEFQRGMRSAQRSLKAFEQSVGAMSRKANIAMAAMGTAALGLAARGVKLAASWEQTEVAFSTMLGSGDRAKKLLGELIAFSTKTPFEPEQVIQTSKTLISFGIQAEKVGGVLKMLGDISSGTGKDLNELARIFGKTFVKGKAQAEELNQFIEGGIPIMDALAKTTGRAKDEIFDMASKGKIGFDEVRGALEELTKEGGTFFDMMQKQSETAIGKWSTLKGNIDELTKVLGQRLLPVVNVALDKLNKLFSLESEKAPSEKVERDRARLRGILEKRGEDPLKVGKMSDEEVKAMLDSIRRTDEIADLVAKGVKKGYLEGLSDQQVSKMWIKTFLPSELEGKSKFAEFWRKVALPSMETPGVMITEAGPAAAGAGLDIWGFFKQQALGMAGSLYNVLRPEMESVSSFAPARLARAVAAGSQEAYGLRVSGREIEEKKLVKKNTDANITTATLIERLATEGVALKNIAIAAAF